MSHTQTLEQLSLRLARLAPIFIRYRILKAVVFGSFARGEPTRRSDVDLLIYTPEELNRMSDRPFIQTILAEGVVIYESEREPISGTALAVDREEGSPRC